MLLPVIVNCQSGLVLPGIELPSIQLSDSDLALMPISFETVLANAPPCTSTSGCTILPVTLLHFEAKRKNNSQVLLNWETTYEYNNAGFGVERSLGNTDHFTNINFVPAKPGTAIKKQYELPDDNRFTGISYYRLRQTDVDGKFSYSNIAAVKGSSDTESLLVFPNPVKTMMQISVYVTQTGASAFTVLNAAGKIVLRLVIRLQPGNNLGTIALGFLPEGIYMVKTTTPSGKQLFSKFIKN